MLSRSWLPEACFANPARLIPILGLASVLPLISAAQNVTDMKPSPQQLDWQGLEMGAIIHFGTNTFLDREWGDGTASPRSSIPNTWIQTSGWKRQRELAFVTFRSETP